MFAPRLHLSGINQKRLLQGRSLQNQHVAPLKFSIPSFSLQLIGKPMYNATFAPKNHHKEQKTATSKTTHIFAANGIQIVPILRQYSAMRQIHKKSRVFIDTLGFVVTPETPKFSLTSFSQLKKFVRYHFSSLYAVLWQIKTPLPKFSLKNLKKEVETIYTQYNTARASLDIRALRPLLTNALYEVISSKMGDKQLPKGVHVQWSCSGLRIKTKSARYLPVDANNSIFQIIFKITSKQHVKVMKGDEVLKEKVESTSDIWAMEAPVSRDKEMKLKLLDILNPDGTGLLPPSPMQDYVQVE